MTRPQLLSVPLVLLLLCVSLPEPADAQRRSTREDAKKSSQTTKRSTRAKNPLEEARTMRKARRSARQTASVLERRWRQAPAEAAKTLREAGFSARQIVAAYRGHQRVTRDEMPGLLVQTGLSPRAAISVSEARSFRDPVFGTVDLDCVGPNGFPVPCGAGSGSPAMGTLSWTPREEGHTGETLTIQSTNIPAVSVRIGNQTLALLEATPTRIRARLPSQPTTGDLVLVRESDGQTGLVHSGYRVTREKAPPPKVPDWRAWVIAALDATVEEVDGWMAGARIVESRCRVDGPNAIGQEGVLTSDYGFQGRIRQALLSADAPSYVADGWQRGFEESLEKWAEQVTIPGLPLYPSFTSVAGVEAPPTPNAPTPLVTLVSSNVGIAIPTALKGRIVSEIGGVAAEPVSLTGLDAFQAYAALVSSSFVTYQAQAMVTNVLGKGPVPVPGGPVVDGSCYTNQGGPFGMAPSFGVFIKMKGLRQF